MPFVKATKRQSRLRMALIGPSGSGKTYTALSIATHLGQNLALVDTERGSASKYAGLFGFDVLELESFSPEQYITAIGEAGRGGYDVLILDSLSHAWAGKDGLLEFVDKVAKRTQSGSSFGAWREATPLHNRLIDAILGAPLHIIATMRAKMEYVQDRDEKTGRTVIRKVGLQPVQRDGLEYEFDVVGDLDMDNNLVISKTRCPQLTGQVIAKAGQQVAEMLSRWLTDGAPAISPASTRAPATTNGHESSDDQVKAALGFPADPVEAPPVTEASLRQEIEGLLSKKGKQLPAFKSWLSLNHKIDYDKANVDQLVVTLDLLKNPKKAS